MSGRHQIDLTTPFVICCFHSPGGYFRDELKGYYNASSKMLCLGLFFAHKNIQPQAIGFSNRGMVMNSVQVGIVVLFALVMPVVATFV